MVRDRGCGCEWSIPSQSASFSPTCSLNLYLAKNSTLLFSSNSTLICKSSRGVGVPLCRLDRPVATIYCVPVMVHEPRRPIAASRPWCNNWQGTRILPHPGKQLRGPRCLRILSGHRELFDDVPGSARLGRGRKVVPGSTVATLDLTAGWPE